MLVLGHVKHLVRGCKGLLPFRQVRPFFRGVPLWLRLCPWTASARLASRNVYITLLMITDLSSGPVAGGGDTRTLIHIYLPYPLTLSLCTSLHQACCDSETSLKAGHSWFDTNIVTLKLEGAKTAGICQGSLKGLIREHTITIARFTEGGTLCPK
jgi:hypothetical protein